MKNEDLYVYKKSDFYEDYIDSQKEYYERNNADAYFTERLAEKDREIALLKERICNGDVSRVTWIDDCIAKDKEIAELKQKLEDVNELVKESKELLKESQKMHLRCADNAIKQLRHQKFKRCLAMAWLCHESSLWWYSKGYGFEKYDKFLEKWEKRWLELADKFKEAK